MSSVGSCGCGNDGLSDALPWVTSRASRELETHPGAYCAHCHTLYRLEDLHRVEPTGVTGGGARYVCGWHYARGER